MKKSLCIVLGLLLLILIGCSKGISGDEKTTEDYVKSQGYIITARKGEILKYIFEINKLNGEIEPLPYSQMWALQKVEPDKYFGKEITIYCFTVKNHPLEKTYKVKTNVYIMISDGKVIGGYSFPDAEMNGSIYTLDGKTLEEVTGLSYQKWRENWKKKYGN